MAQETKRDQPVRLPNPSAQPFVTALKTVRFFAVIFFWVTMVCVLAHVAAFVATEWARVYDAAGAEAVEEPTAQPEGAETVTGEAAAPAPDEPGAEGAQETSRWAPEKRARYRRATERVLGGLRFVGVLCGVLLWVTAFLYLQITLLGRLSGIRPLTNVVFLMLLFLATAVPWQTVFQEESVRSFFDFSQLWSAYTERGAVGGFDLWDTGWYYFRFFALPLLGAVLLALAGLQFARGYRESVVANE